jgi:hypothetical protein
MIGRALMQEPDGGILPTESLPYGQTCHSILRSLGE